MGEGPLRGSLEWPFENEHRWVSVSFQNAPTHRVLVHAKLGFCFDEHGWATPDLVAMEARMMDAGQYCGCHVLALWWQGILEWKRGVMAPNNDDTRMLEAYFTVEGSKEAVACSIEAEPLAMQFFVHLVKTVCPNALFGRPPFNKPARASR